MSEVIPGVSGHKITHFSDIILCLDHGIEIDSSAHVVRWHIAASLVQFFTDLKEWRKEMDKSQITVVKFAVRIRKESKSFPESFQTDNCEMSTDIARARLFSTEGYAAQSFFSDVPCEVVPVTLSYPAA